MTDSHGRLVFINNPSSKLRRAKFKTCQMNKMKGEEIDLYYQNNSPEASFIIINQDENLSILSLSSSVVFHDRMNDRAITDYGQVVARFENKSERLECDTSNAREYLCNLKRKKGNKDSGSSALITTTFNFGILILLATSFLSISSTESAANRSCDKSQSKCDHNHNQNNHHNYDEQPQQHLSRHYNRFHNEQSRYIKEPVLLKLQQRHKSIGDQLQQEYYKRHKRHYASSILEQTIAPSSFSSSESIPTLNESINAMKTSNKTQLDLSFKLNTLDSIRIAAFASKLEQWYTCHRLATNELLATLSAARVSSLEGKSRQMPATARCQAHFDGHLCWPAAKAGQLVKLPCPRLNWLSNVEQALVTQQREQLQPRVQEQQSVKSVINLIQLPTTTTTTTVQPTGREEEEGIFVKSDNDSNSLLTTSLDATNTRAFVDDESERPISQSVSVTGKIEGKFSGGCSRNNMCARV